jgi:hypothetical protein
LRYKPVADRNDIVEAVTQKYSKLTGNSTGTSPDAGTDIGDDAVVSTYLDPDSNAMTLNPIQLKELRQTPGLILYRTAPLLILVMVWVLILVCTLVQ